MPQDPPSSAEDLASQLAAEFGFDPSQLGAGGGGDPYAIFASGVAPTDRVGVRSRPNQRPGPPLGDGRQRSRVYTGSTLVTATVGDVLRKFYELSPSTLRRMQALLFAGGFYGDMDVTDVAWGVADEQSFTAWSQAVARTARMNAAGKDVTYEQVIGDAAWAAGLDPTSLGEALDSGDTDVLERLLGTGEGGRVLDVILSDPNALRSTMDRVSSSVLGRKANASEQRMFISMIHNLQRQGQIARQTAEDMLPVGTEPFTALGLDDSTAPPGDVVTEYAPPDEAASAEAMIRSENPEEAGAHDIAMTFADFLEMLPAPVNVPRVTI